MINQRFRGISILQGDVDSMMPIFQDTITATHMVLAKVLLYEAHPGRKAGFHQPWPSWWQTFTGIIATSVTVAIIGMSMFDHIRIIITQDVHENQL